MWTVVALARGLLKETAHACLESQVPVDDGAAAAASAVQSLPRALASRSGSLCGCGEALAQAAASPSEMLAALTTLIDGSFSVSFAIFEALGAGARPALGTDGVRRHGRLVAVSSSGAWSAAVFRVLAAAGHLPRGIAIALLDRGWKGPPRGAEAPSGGGSPPSSTSQRRPRL